MVLLLLLGLPLELLLSEHGQQGRPQPSEAAAAVQP
jgi:hypothetical protein